MLSILAPFNKNFSFSKITAWLFIIWAVISVSIFLLLGESDFINIKSLLLMVLLSLIFFVAIIKSNEANSAHIIILSWFVLMYFCIRLFALLLFPPSILEFLSSDPLNGDEVFKGLNFIFFGCIAMLFGIFFASHIIKTTKLNNPIVGKINSIWSITGYWICTYIAAYYVRIHLGVTIFGAPEHWGHRMAWVGIIFDTDVALILTIAWGLIKWQRDELDISGAIHVALLILIWLAFSVMIGSRGGPLRILNCIFLVSLAINPKFKISVVKFLTISVLFFCVNFYVFYLGNVARAHQLSPDLSIQGISKQFQDKENEKQKLSRAKLNESAIKKYSPSKYIVENIFQPLVPTITRLAIIDYALVIISREPDQKVIDYYINSLHPIKNFINNLVPGEIFMESTVNTSRVFTMAYRGTSLNDINLGFLSEPWTVWGMTWILAGYYGIFILFFLSFIFQAALIKVQQLPINNIIFVKTVYFILVINIGYIMFGIDHWMTAIVHFSLASIIALAFIYGFDLLACKFKAGRICADK